VRSYGELLEVRLRQAARGSGDGFNSTTSACLATGASTMTSGDVDKQQPNDDGLRFRPMADLGSATSTCSYGWRLLLPLYVTDGGLLPRRLDLGLAGLDPGQDFFKKLILGVGPQQPIRKRNYFLYRRNGIGWLNRYL
jgi:hypothetical protein